MRYILYFLGASIIVSLITLRFLYVSSKKEKLYREKLSNNKEEKSEIDKEERKPLIKALNY